MIKNIINSKSFLEEFRKEKKDFTREKKLPFHILILFQINIIKSALQNELDNFFKVLHNKSLPSKYVTVTAYSNARKKLKYQAFIELRSKANNYFYENYLPKTWNGFYLKAVDGTTMFLPKTPKILAHFGEHRNSLGKSSVLASVSQIFDCLNQVTNSAIIAPEKFSERELLKQQMDCLGEKDLLLLDRGYPAFWVFAMLKEKNINFCSRIECEKWKIVKEFYNSDENDRNIDMELTTRSKKYCEQNGIQKNTLKLRLVKVKLDSGQTEVLITTLTDREKYNINIFKDLYNYRWPVEEDYKVMKHRLEIENFTGKSVDSIYQDFHAKIFTKNLIEIFAILAQEKVDDFCKTRKRKWKYKINFTNALSKMKNTIILLFSRQRPKRILLQYLELISLVTEAVRPGRKYKRQPMRPKRFYPQYKSFA